MKVKKLKEMLNLCNDDDWVIFDIGDTMKATPENEVVYAFKHKKVGDSDYAPVVVLQRRADFDVKEELEAYLGYCINGNIDETDALANLFELGYTPNDFNYNPDRYNWALKVAKEHGLYK